MVGQSIINSELTPLARYSQSVIDQVGVGGVTRKALWKPSKPNTSTSIKLHRTWCPEDSANSMSANAFVVNMFADLCPPGLLPLASGLRGTGLLPALVLTLLLLSACVYTMWAVGRTMEITGGQTFRAQWAVTLGHRTAWIPVAVVMMVCFGCNLANSCFFAEMLANVMTSFGINWASRGYCLISCTLCLLIPLCMLKDLSGLTFSSLLALVVVAYTTAVMCLRAVDGTYSHHGRFFASLEYAPEVPRSHARDFGLDTFLLVNFLACGFLSHYNGCKYYRELRGHTPKKLRQCTMLAMGITAVFYGVSSVAAFQTFGTHANGVILDSYAKDDTLINIARVGMSLSIIASFPLTFSGLREATIELAVLMRPQCQELMERVWSQNLLSLCLLFLETLCALVFTNTKLVVGIVGAVCGTAIIYVIPCVLYARALMQFPQKDP